jgi:PAS domain S-box-containing protein
LVEFAQTTGFSGNSLSWHRKKNKREKPPGSDVPSFGEWLKHSDFLSERIHPAKRVSRILTEIQKRTLSEQAILLSHHQSENKCEVTILSPDGEEPQFPPELLDAITRKTLHENRLLLISEIETDPSIGQQFWSYNCETLLAYPFASDMDRSDVLLLVNYSDFGEPSRIKDIVYYAGSMLSLATSNHRLYLDLQQKDVELSDWAGHIEKRIEEGTKKLLERELQYHSLFEGTNDGILVHDRDGRILETNKVSCRLFGYDRKEFLALSWSNLFGSRRTDDLAGFFGKIHRNETVAPVEALLKRKDGSVFHAELSSRKVKFMGAEAIQSFIRDVSVRKELEMGLNEEREKYRILVESSLMGVFIIQDGIIRFANTKFAEILQYSCEELLGRNYFDLIDPEDRSMVIARETKRMSGGESLEHYEIRYTKNDGSRCWCEIHCCRVVVDGLSSILGNVLDISQRKHWEMQLLETQKMESIGTLAGGIAHDFNNLLGGILGYASLLLSEMKEDHPYYQDLLAIAETAKKAADLTNRLLAFARGGKYQVSTLHINKIAEAVLGILSHSIDPSVVIETRLSENLWAVNGDSRQIHQTFMNICLNAVDAMPGGGHFVFSTENAVLDDSFVQGQIGMKPGEYVKITIADTGFGMDERTKTRMFEPFFTTKPANERKGLGLSMVYGIVKNHNGFIQVDSERGKGTALTLYLPRTLEPEVQTTKQQASPKSGNKVLLVDDEEIIRHVGDRMLKKKGFEVILAKNGREAVEIYQKQKSEIAVVLMDLVMPEMGGKEAYQKLKQINPDIRVVFTSGYGPEDRPDLIDGSNVLFLQKPFHTEILYQTIQTALRNGGTTKTHSLE